MSRMIERHRVPLGPRLTLVYHRTESGRSPLQVDCFFRLGYADLAPGQVYALTKAIQGQYAPAWRPRLLLTPDWSRFSFVASPDYRRELDSQWLRLFELESALTSLEPLKEGLLQEQRWHQESREYLLNHHFHTQVFQGTAYDRLPLGQEQDLSELGQEALLDSYAQGLETAQVCLLIQDHQPLHEVLDRCRSLLRLPQAEPPLPAALDLSTMGFREQRLTQTTEGAWLYLGLVLPGMDQAAWSYGPLFQAWLEEIWAEKPAHPELALLSLEWQGWQRAALLQFKMHTHVLNHLQEQKVALIHWLAELRQTYLTPRRLKRAVHRVLQSAQAEPRPLYLEIDEIQQGWGHVHQRLQHLSISSFQQALERYLNADRLVLMEVCSEHVPKRQRPDPREHLYNLGYAPGQRGSKTMAGKYSEIQRLHLTPGWSMWLIPHESLSRLELGLWFSSGAAQDPLPGTSRFLLAVLRQRFEQVLEAQGQRGAWSESWQSGVTADSSFFKWAVPWAELPQALKILHELLQDLNVGPERVQNLRQTFQTQLLAAYLNPLQTAQEQFSLSGFPNHPYGQPVAGSYLSLRQIHASVLQARWRELRQCALAHPLLVGHIPAFLNAELLLPAFSGIQAEGPVLRPLPTLRTRRGEIFVRSEHLSGLRLEGQIFTQALPLEEHMPLQLVQQWIQDRVRSHVGIPLESHLVTLQQAWYFAFSGLYGREERLHWLPEAMQITEPMDMLKQRLVADLRARFESTHLLWPDLVHWLNLGGSPGAFVDREHEVLTLSREQVEALMQDYLTHESEWLQVVFQAQDSKMPVWGI